MNEYHFCREENLLQMIKDGNYIAFEELYARYFDLLFGYAYNIVRDLDITRDIIQDIFTWFWANRDQWKLESCKGYLLTAVKFKTASYFRSSKAQESFYDKLKEVPPLHQDDSLQLEVKQLQELIESLVDDLPSRCKEIFKLSRFSHRSNKEIAKELGISEKTVEAQITIALKKLRLTLGKYNYILFFLI
ncbi:RNA polymerase sigma-70 factor [Sphingobacterium sp. SRCM116780]|uniref:RNA polymerase sigma-70 factor n=1 Tax=Sphingobacterium sp. SRCM116780 TaxID=2907623 RepID=UPI001F1A84A7|nr:RNA polymerase sigma-70 factor [Sphingobacterium sp. SRCM116780]UIR54898.1 RNA polymerase sigma-70 factor [Sphingobacterium sp. SRCM116780]